MLAPKKVKRRKVQKGRIRGVASRGSKIAFGSVCLQAVEGGLMTSRQIEAGRIAMTRRIKRQGQVWIRVFPDKPVSKKPAETRMGSGKGGLDHWAAVIHPGRVIFEVDGVADELAERALTLAASKLPFKTKIVRRSTMVWEV